MKTSVYITVTAFDKHSSDFYGTTFIASSRKEANKKMEEFDNSVPYTKWYSEIEIVETLTLEQEEIVMDLHYNYL